MQIQTIGILLVPISFFLALSGVYIFWAAQSWNWSVILGSFTGTYSIEKRSKFQEYFHEDKRGFFDYYFVVIIDIGYSVNGVEYLYQTKRQLIRNKNDHINGIEYGIRNEISQGKAMLVYYHPNYPNKSVINIDRVNSFLWILGFTMTSTLMYILLIIFL